MAKKSELNDLLNAMENKSNDVNLSMLQNYLGEYLKSYFLVGYDHDEGSVLIINGKTEQDFDALECLINRFTNMKLDIASIEDSENNEE
mgnify:CR=1 FL=1|tara:strand:+ start:1084 stop:1350 length:267 start_codon:yes stop_codon:yes gene_type:complete